jgi:hypothetical protein
MYFQKTINTTKVRIDKAKLKVAAATEVVEVVFEEKAPKIPQPPNNMPIDEWIIDTKIKVRPYRYYRSTGNYNSLCFISAQQFGIENKHVVSAGKIWRNVELRRRRNVCA